jgi:pimeloyl-ACP methyl ester carboxylesterase
VNRPDAPETRYALSGDVAIAYQVVGDGPVELVVVPGAISNIDLEWDEPRMAAYNRKLASFSRLILFDKRGTGLSDQVLGVPTLEERMDDVRAVMDAAGSERAVLMGTSEGAAMAALFAATYPERTAALVLYGGYPSLELKSRDRFEAMLAELPSSWGTQAAADDDLRRYAPSVAHEPALRAWWPRYIRACASPGAMVALLRMNVEIDVTHVLPAIRVPTVVLHRVSDRVVGVERGREMAQLIPNARFVELSGADHYAWFEHSDAIVAEVERVVSSVAGEAALDRVLATVLFTDIVGATERAGALGDRAWRELLERHHAIVRNALARFRGVEVDTAGDGFFARFDGPARAIRCATAIRDGLQELGLDVRAGLHTGECEVMGEKVGGIAVHIGARVASQAGPGEVLVSSTVRDLVAGSGIAFEERGTTTLKGLPEQWTLYAVTE